MARSLRFTTSSMTPQRNKTLLPNIRMLCKLFPRKLRIGHLRYLKNTSRQTTKTKTAIDEIERNNSGGTKSSWAVCIPCAITAEAVAYYKDLVNKYRKQTVKRHQASTIFKKEFIIDGKTFNDVNLITLKLAFNQSFCASGTEGMHIKKERIVIVDDAGIVLHISGDGPTGVPIFA